MNCDELLRRLTDYTDGALPADVCAEIEVHVARCVPCARVREELLVVVKLCGTAPRLCMPDDLRQKLLNLLREEPS